MAQDTQNSRSVISSGNPELDSKMGGGIPAGSLTLVEGGSGAGKSVLTQQIISGALNDGFTVTLFTSENTIKSLMRQMNSIDLDVTDYLLMGLLHVYPMELSGLEEEAPRQLLEAMRSEEDHEVLVIDSFTSAVSSASDAAIVNFFENSKRLCAQGHSIMLTLHGSAIDDDMLNPLRGMCDAHLRLRTEQDGQKLIKTLEVAKVRGAASVTGAIVGFDVEPGWGMRVVPISKARG